MPAHTGIASFSDTVYSISATLPATYDSAGYGSTTITWTEIGKVQSFPEFGSQSPVNEFVPIKGAVEYFKGARRYGSGPMVVGDLPVDAGQVLLKAAEASQNKYSMKLTYPDGEIHYLEVIVSSWKLSGAQEGTAMTRTADISLMRAPVVVAAA
ncbi:MAG: hypothetical protein KF908_05235 [Nitrosomonas sp.]|nr:hypothetical protein [Nitrosomonas sp.]